jgi:hypothetical protein
LDLAWKLLRELPLPLLLLLRVTRLLASKANLGTRAGYLGDFWCGSCTVVLMWWSCQSHPTLLLWLLLVPAEVGAAAAIGLAIGTHSAAHDATGHAQTELAPSGAEPNEALAVCHPAR